MKMVDVISQVSNLESHEIFMDNFFTSNNLLRDLHSRNLRATGILRSNRTEKAPLKLDSELQNRGEYHSLCDGIVRMIRLRDSKVVTLSTNYDSILPMYETMRHNKSTSGRLKIPHAFASYNASMGAVDITNRFVVDYESVFRGKKWYWPLFINCIATMRVASWQILAHANHGSIIFFENSCPRSRGEASQRDTIKRTIRPKVKTFN